MNEDDKLRVAVRRFAPFETSIQSQFCEFKKVSGSTLELDARSFDLPELYAATLGAGGLGKGEWDIAFLPTDWLPEAIEGNALADIGLLLEKDPIEGYPADWSPTLTSSQSAGGRTFGLPFHDGPECLIYRRDLFENPRHKSDFEARFAYPLIPPSNWDQFYDAARFFTRREEGLYGTVFAAFPDGHNTLYDFCLQLWSRGGELLDADGRVCLTRPEAVDALDYYRTIATDSEAVPPNLLAFDSVRTGELFLRGSVALMVNWFGFAAHCALADCPTKGNVWVAPVPSARSGVNATLSVYWVLAIGAGSPKKSAAYAFLKHIVSPPMEKLATLAGIVGCRRSTWLDSEINSRIPFFKQLPDLSAVARTLPWTAALPQLAHLIDEAITRAITTSEPSSVILSQAQAKAQLLDLRDRR